MSEYLENLGKFLYERRTKLNYTQNNLASFLNVSNQTIYKYEHGLSSPDFTILGKYADILEVSLDDLINTNSETNEYIKNEIEFDSDKFSSNLKILRIKNNLTLSKLQELINVKYQTISKCEKGESFPSIKQFLDLSGVYNTSLYDIYYGIDSNIKDTIIDEKSEETITPKVIEKKKRTIFPWVLSIVLLLLFIANIIFTTILINDYKIKLDDNNQLLNNYSNNDSNNNQNNIDTSNNSDKDKSNNLENNSGDSDTSNTIDSNGTNNEIESSGTLLSTNDENNNIVDSSAIAQENNTNNNEIESSGTLLSTNDENNNIVDSSAIAQDNDPIVINYTVNHYLENINDDSYTLDQTENYSAEANTLVTARINYYDGFILPSAKTIIIDENTTSIDYYYNRIKYSISFNTNGVDTVESIETKSDSTLSLDITPTRNGYKFLGWYFDSDLTNKIENNTISNINSNTILYASWEIDYKNGTYTYEEKDDYIIIKSLIDGNLIDIPNVINNKPVREINIESSSTLYKITIPNTITKITKFDVTISNEEDMELSFYYDGNINNWIGIEFDESIFKYDNLVFYYKENSEFTKLGDELTIPNGTNKKINDYAFSKQNIAKSLIINEGIESIGDNAFSNSSSLKIIDIPSSLNEIKKDAFYKCSNLEKINISDLVSWMNIDFKLYSDEYDQYSNNPLYYGNHLYLNGELITKLTIPEEIVTIKPYTLVGSEDIKEIVILDNVLTIESSALGGTMALEKLTIPFIGRTRVNESDEYQYPLGYIFGDEMWGLGCTFQSFKCPESELDENFFKDYSIPQVKEIILTGSSFVPSGAFENISSLESVTLPSSVTKLGNKAFYRCGELRDINFPSGLLSIGDFAFCECNSFEEIVLPNSVNTLGESAFYQSYNLKSITLSNKIETIPIGCFSNCISLEDVNLPSSLKYINNGAFGCCESLEAITIPENVISINQYAFDNCMSLKTIVLNNKLQVIGDGAFNNCRALESITFPNSLIGFGERTFYNCKSLKSVTVPSGVQTINVEMFAECTSLETVVLPSTITWIAPRSFVNCSSLKTINIPEGVISIDGWTFTGCTSLEHIELSSNVASIGLYAFENCTSLKTIGLSEKLSSIDGYAFYHCINLKTINYNNNYSTWQEIDKKLLWDFDTGDYTIYMTDRIVSK